MIAVRASIGGAAWSVGISLSPLRKMTGAAAAIAASGPSAVAWHDAVRAGPAAGSLTAGSVAR